MNSHESLSFREKVNLVRNEAAADYDQATSAQKAGLLATAGTLIFEWGTGNEAMLGIVGGTVYANTGSVLMTAAATGLASFAEQGAFGAVMAYNVGNFPKPMKKVEEVFFADKEEEVKVVVGSGKNYGARWNSGFVLGTSILMLIDNAHEPKSAKENLKNSTVNAALIGASVVAIAASAAALSNAGHNAGGGWETASDVLVNVIKNPLTYIGLLLGRFGLSKLSKYKNKSSS